MEFIWQAVQKYGPSILVIAAVIIVFVGVLKLFKAFDKISSKDVKKAVYFAVDAVLAFAGAAVYFAIFGIPFTGYYALYSVSLLGVTTLLYSLYEHWGPRWCVRKLIGLVASWFKKNPEAKLTKDAEKYGLVKAINYLQAKYEAQEAEEKAKAEAEKKAAETATSATTDTTTVVKS